MNRPFISRKKLIAYLNGRLSDAEIRVWLKDDAKNEEEHNADIAKSDAWDRRVRQIIEEIEQGCV